MQHQTLLWFIFPNWIEAVEEYLKNIFVMQHFWMSLRKQENQAIMTTCHINPIWAHQFWLLNLMKTSKKGIKNALIQKIA